MQGFGIHHAINPNSYRGVFGSDPAPYAADVADIIRSSTPGCVAGFISETIQVSLWEGRWRRGRRREGRRGEGRSGKGR